MEIKKEDLGKSKVKLLIKVSSPEMRTFFARVYNKIAPTIEIKGFRPGMAPKSMTIAAIGENRLQQEIIDLALRETFAEALKKENLMPIAPPKINIKMLKDLMADTAELEYEVEIDLLPEVKLGDYKKIRLKKNDAKIEVSADEIEQVLSHLARTRAEFKDISRSVKKGDRLEINFEGFDQGVKRENLSSRNYPVILGSKILIPEFEAQLIGLKKGDKKEFTLEMAPSATEKKKKINFKVEVLQTQEVILPKIDDELARKYQKKDLADLKKAIKDDIIQQKKQQHERNIENAVLEELIKITKVEIPDSLIQQEIDRQINEIRSRTTQMGLTFEKYLESLKKTESELRESLKPQAEKTIKIGLALGEIVKREKIDPKDKEAGKKALDILIAKATK
jgi:trigger factor